MKAMNEIKTYEEMNKQICGLLRLAGDNVSNYAAQRINELESEIASLRARLENAVELPRLEISPYDDNDTLLYCLENGHIQQECFNNKHPEQLQKRLAELRGDRK